jgi:hypothetical protein
MVLALAASVVAVLVCAASAHAAFPKFNYAFTFGGPGSGLGMFNEPLGIAVSAPDATQRFVYVVDGHNFRIQRFAIDGSGAFEWGRLDDSPSGPGGDDNGYYYPQDLAVRTSEFTDNTVGDEVFIADTANNRIEATDDEGKVDWKVGGTQGAADKEFNNPAGVAANPTNLVYVANTRNNRVVVLNAFNKGAFVQKWGSFGTGDGQFQVPIDIAYCENSVYVSEEFGSRVQKFSDTGVFQAKWGAGGGAGVPGVGIGEFSNPDGIAVDDACNVYVAEQTAGGRVQIFDKFGNYLGVVTGEAAPGGHIYPHDIAVTEYKRPSDGKTIRRIYVSDWGNGRIVVFDEDFPETTQPPPTGGPQVTLKGPKVTNKGFTVFEFCPPVANLVCDSDATLETAAPKRRAVIAKATVLAHKRLKIAPGATAKLRLVFTKRARKLIAKRGKLKATLVLKVTDGAGASSTTRKPVKLP